MKITIEGVIFTVLVAAAVFGTAANTLDKFFGTVVYEDRTPTIYVYPNDDLPYFGTIPGFDRDVEVALKSGIPGTSVYEKAIESVICGGFCRHQKSLDEYIHFEGANQRGVGGKGWRGDKNWRDAVREVESGGTIRDINEEIPTEQEALDLINESGGTPLRVEGPHEAPNPHNFPHINYETPSGGKGTIEILP